MRNDHNILPIWLGGIMLALILIFIGTRGSAVNNAALIQRFAPRPTDPNAPTAQPFQLPQVHLPDLPPDLRRTLSSLHDRFASGQTVPPLTPVASGPRMRVEVREVRRSGDRVRIVGSVTNISGTPLAIPDGAFTFRDSAGILYTTSGGSTMLQPSQSTALDLTLSLPDGRGLTLIATLPPDPPLEQVIVVEATT